MHRFVMRIKFCISLKAWVPGLHFLVRRTAGVPLTLLFPPGCGTMRPRGGGLKNLPSNGCPPSSLQQQISINYGTCISTFSTYNIHSTVLYCIIQKITYYFRHIRLTSAIQRPSDIWMCTQFEFLYKCLCRCSPLAWVSSWC